MPPRPITALRDVDGYAEIGDYGLVGDGRSVALVGPDGDVDWWAVPRIDAVPAFSAILDPRWGGRLRLRPTDPAATVEQRYVPNTNALETVWRTDGGTVHVTDALNLDIVGELPWVEFARRVEGVDGAVEMCFELEPGDGLHSWSPWAEPDKRGCIVHAGDVTFGVRTSPSVPLRIETPTVRSTFTTEAGRRDTIGIVAAADAPVYMAHPKAIERRLDSTLDQWRAWTRHLTWPKERRARITRSALVLRLLMMSDTGAIAAAATTSLPEQIGGPKNWDYRFAWVRDAALTIDAMMLCGLQVEAQGAVAWLLGAIRTNGGKLHIMFTLDGDLAPGETDADVPGYRGSRPIRIGNDAVGQMQLGVFGDLFGTVSAWVYRGHVLDVKTARLLADLADECADTWSRPDSGIWELYDVHHYTSSKMNCWRALNDAADMAEKGHIAGSPDRWRAEAARVRDFIETNCWSERKQAYTSYAGTEDLDASVLLGANFGYERGPRMSTTVDAIIEELGEDELVYRYTGVHREEQTFLACAFWLVSALVATDRHDEAVHRLGRLEKVISPLGILSEMAAPGSRELVGNTPQALSHLAYVSAAAAVDAHTFSDDEMPAESL